MNETLYVLLHDFFDGFNVHQKPHYLKIEDDIIVSQGDLNEDILKKISSENIKIMDYRKKFVTPGFIDAHNHFMLTALKARFYIDFSNVFSIEDFVNVLKKNKNNDFHGWILGYKLNEYNFSDNNIPDKKIIDRVFDQNPVFITQTTEHYGICNSEALRISGIDKNTPDPEGGKISRYYNNEPDGILYEAPAMDPVKDKIPGFNIIDYKDAILYSQKLYRKAGLSFVKDTGGTGKDINEDMRICALNELSHEGKIKIRIGIALPIYSLNDLDYKVNLSRKIVQNDFIKFSGFKLFLDGSILAKTAWMKKPWYVDGNKNYFYGINLWNMGDFNTAIEQLSKIQTNISIHAIGDRAIEEALNAIEYAGLKKCNSTFSIIHADVLSKENMERIKNLNVSIETQSAFIYHIGNAELNNLKGKMDIELFPYKTMINLGIKIANSSDSPVSDFSPLTGLYSSLFRKTKNNEECFDKNECLDIVNALKIYTSTSSDVMGLKNYGNFNTNSIFDPTVFENDYASLYANLKRLGVRIHCL